MNSSTIFLASNYESSLSTGDLILIISLIATICIHILLAIIDFKRAKFNRFDKMTQRFLDIGHSIKDYSSKDYDLWDSSILNQCEYISYLINNKKIDFKFVKGFLDDALITYYEKLLKEKYPKELKDPKKYAEFKILYKKLKNI